MHALLTRIPHHRSSCPSRQGYSDCRRDSTLRVTARYVTRIYVGPLAYSFARIPLILLHRPGLQLDHDLHRRTSLWPLQPPCLHLYLLSRRLRLDHVRQRFRCGCEAYVRGQQPIHSSKHICLRDRDSIMHFGANELLQQSTRYLFHERVRLCSH